MEDALARCGTSGSGTRLKVLILVVMEDALAPVETAYLVKTLKKS